MELGHEMIVLSGDGDTSETAGQRGGAVRRGTLRGQKFAASPIQITKLLRNAVSGALFPIEAVLAGAEKSLAKTRIGDSDEGDKMDGALCVPKQGLNGTRVSENKRVLCACSMIHAIFNSGASANENTTSDPIGQDGAAPCI